MIKATRFPILFLVALVLGIPGTPTFADETIPAPPDLTSPPADAERLPSGLASKVLAEGRGAQHPDRTSHVIVHYTAWKESGEMFDSSVVRRKLASLDLSVMIEGLTEGIPLMVVGEKRRFWIPPQLAYSGVPEKPQGAFVFDVELFDFISTPNDVGAPPESAESLKSGLSWTVLHPGTGSAHPRRTSRVEVHYSGWTTDGKMFDSSLLRGKPATFRLSEVIKGWTVGLQLMVEGEKRRFWIPAKMAYKGVRDRPQGMLVFDIELIAIK